MRFHVYDPFGIESTLMFIKVTEVFEDFSEALATDIGEEPALPEVGWQLSTPRGRPTETDK